MSFSYAKAISPLAGAAPSIQPMVRPGSTSNESASSHTLVQEWLKGTSPTGRHDKPLHPRPECGRRASEPIVKVIRKGKVYSSRPTPPGELNARERRKLRRAAERGEIPMPKPSTVEGKDGWVESVSSVSGNHQEQQALLELTPSEPRAAYGSKDYTFPPPQSPPYPSPVINQAIHFSNPFLGGSSSPIPPTPTPSNSSKDLHEDSVADPITPPSSPPRAPLSRRPSLNAQAETFNPSRICPITPRSPGTAARARPKSLVLQSEGTASVGDVCDDLNRPDSPASTSFMPQGRRHSIALAAWEAAQRRLSQQYDTPKYSDIDGWQAGSPQAAILNGDVRMVHSPQMHASIPPISPFGQTDPGVYRDSTGHGFPSPLSTPRSPHFSPHSSPVASSFGGSISHSQDQEHAGNTRFQSGSGNAYGHRSARSCSSLPSAMPFRSRGTGLRAPMGVTPVDRRISVSSAGSLSSVHAEFGEDGEADNMDDMCDLTVAAVKSAAAARRNPQSSTMHLLADAVADYDPRLTSKIIHGDPTLYEEKSVAASWAAFAHSW